MADPQAEQEVTPAAPEPVKATPSALTPLQQQYELGDETPVEASSSPAETQGGTVTAAPAASARDPETGRFLPKKHPSVLERQARDLGFSDDDLAEVGTEDLRGLVHDARMERMWREKIGATQGTSQEPRPAQAEDLGLGELEQDLDPKLLGFLKNLSRENAELRANVRQMQEAHNNNLRESFAQRADRCFAGNPDLFGEGAGVEMAQGSPEYRRRMAVLGEMNQIKAGTFEQKYQKAVSTLFGKKPEPRPEPKPGKGPTPEEWAEGSLARPTQRRGSPEPFGVDRAKKAVRELAKEAGAVGLDNGTTSLDEFPD